MRTFRTCLFVLFLLLVSLPALGEAKHLTVLHFNDIHGHLESGKEGGGAARIASIVRTIEKENRAAGAETLVLFGGDAFSGTLLSSEFEGAAEIDFFNLLGVDAMVLGNHEFDFGRERLEALTQKASFPILSANIFLKGQDVRFARPSIVLRNGLTIDLFGLTTQETPRTTNPANVTDFSFRDPIREAKEQVRALEHDAPIRIALTHLGVKKDIALAKKVTGLAAIVGGHDHVAPQEYCRVVKKIPICQTPSNGKYVGRIDFKVDGRKAIYQGSSLMATDLSVSEDPAAATLVATYDRRLGKKYDVVVGTAAKDLRIKRGDFFPLGALVAMSALAATKAEAAFINSGGIRAPLLRGPIRLRGVVEVLPFPNRLVVLPLSGVLLERVIAHGARRGGGAFLQVAGMSYRLDGDRPIDIRVAGEPIEPGRIYHIATVDFLANGGEGLTMLAKVADRTPTDVLIRDAFVDFIKRKKVIP